MNIINIVMILGLVIIYLIVIAVRRSNENKNEGTGEQNLEQTDTTALTTENIPSDGSDVQFESEHYKAEKSFILIYSDKEQAHISLRIFIVRQIPC